MGEGGGGVAAKRKARVLAIAATAILAALLPALAGRALRALRVPAPFYTLACDASGLPDAYVGPYLAAVRRAVDRWNQAAPQRLFAWTDAPHAEILIRFVPSLEEACGDINASPRGAQHPY